MKGSAEDLCVKNTDPTLAKALCLLNPSLGFQWTWISSVCVHTCKCFLIPLKNKAKE